MNTNEMMRFYLNNGTEKTVEMIRKGKYENFLIFMISPECECTPYAKSIANHLLELV